VIKSPKCGAHRHSICSTYLPPLCADVGGAAVMVESFVPFMSFISFILGRGVTLCHHSVASSSLRTFLVWHAMVALLFAYGECRNRAAAASQSSIPGKQSVEGLQDKSTSYS
jgi:hypothetical protein